MKKWISAFRLRTLPLSLSCIFMGNFLAGWKGSFDWGICLMTILTTVFLQILSNLANDYGDSIHGADSTDREGPSRAVQTGEISLSGMKRATMLFAVLSLISGIGLLVLTFYNQWILILSFLALGLVAIFAAITYTAGRKPYGYAGLGDISVFLFFGLVGVLGSCFLQTGVFDWQMTLPAMSCGLLSTGVLNINNIRDIQSDEAAGKRSIPVRIGRSKAVYYHVWLLSLAMILTVVFVMMNYQNWMQLFFLLSIPLFVKNIAAVAAKNEASALDPYLKQLALSTLLFVLLFGIGHIF